MNFARIFFFWFLFFSLNDLGKIPRCSSVPGEVAIVAKKSLKMSNLGSNLSGLSLGSKKSKSSKSSLSSNGSSSASAEEDTKSNSSTKSETNS